eukprot:1158551-Pelagomonas_calceolata.AAC.5
MLDTATHGNQKHFLARAKQTHHRWALQRAVHEREKHVCLTGCAVRAMSGYLSIIPNTATATITTTITSLNGRIAFSPCTCLLV